MRVFSFRALGYALPSAFAPVTSPVEELAAASLLYPTPAAPVPLSAPGVGFTGGVGSVTMKGLIISVAGTRFFFSISLSVSGLLSRRMHHISVPKMARRATPPTTPPAIAATGGPGDGVAVVLGDEVEVGTVTVEVSAFTLSIGRGE